MPGTAELRSLRRRIHSVENTQKITSAMELIAASRIARARQAVEDARPYARGITQVIRDLASVTDVSDHPLLVRRDPTETVGVVVITSDRGLAGAYNSNLLRRAERLMNDLRSRDHGVALYQIGRKGESYFRYRGEEFADSWFGVTDKPSYDDAVDIGEQVMADYRDEKIDELHLVYTDFRSSLNQVPTAIRLLPIEPGELSGGQAYPPLFVFEPDPDEILERLLPRYIEHRIFAGLLESAASEHASRQRAMKAASDNAEEIVGDLTRQANRARQSAITTEINEIVGGAEALAER
ncbi:F0F1 ATP synthase subunit gamma [soil metagenome]